MQVDNSCECMLRAFLVKSIKSEQFLWSEISMQDLPTLIPFRMKFYAEWPMKHLSWKGKRLQADLSYVIVHLVLRMLLPFKWENLICVPVSYCYIRKMSKTNEPTPSIHVEHMLLYPRVVYHKSDEKWRVKNTQTIAIVCSNETGCTKLTNLTSPVVRSTAIRTTDESWYSIGIQSRQPNGHQLSGSSLIPFCSLLYRVLS